MSTAQAKVDVLFSGKTLPDADPEQAVAAFAQMTGIDTAKARLLITGGSPKMAKRGLAPEAAQALVMRLAAIGIQAIIRQTAESVSTPPPETETAQPVPAATGNGTEPLQETAVSSPASAQGGETVCPKCGHRQLGEECANCGIIFRKWAKQNEPNEPQPEPPLLAESYCTNCGKPVAAQAPACTHCGLPPRLERKHCPDCGAATDPRQVLCVKCGADLAAPQAAPAPAGGKTRPAWLRPALIGGGALALLGIVLAVVLGFSHNKTGSQASNTSAAERAVSGAKTGGTSGPAADSAEMKASNLSAASAAAAANMLEYSLYNWHKTYGVGCLGTNLTVDHCGVLHGPLSVPSDTERGFIICGLDNQNEKRCASGNDFNSGGGVNITSQFNIDSGVALLASTDSKDGLPSYTVVGKHKNGNRVFSVSKQGGYREDGNDELSPIYFCENQAWVGLTEPPGEMRFPAREGAECGGYPVPTWQKMTRSTWQELGARPKQAESPFAATLRAAESGDAQAQYDVGMAYSDGKNGVSQDWQKAMYWFRKAAEQDFVTAQKVLGIAYTGGLGVTQDYELAAYWLRKAAEQGDADAQYWLGVLYGAGLGVKMDFAKSKYWVSKAAAQGQKQAQEYLPTLESLPLPKLGQGE